MTRRLWSALLVATLGLAAAAPAAADDVVYKYRTADGQIEYGTDPPPDATILEEVGTVDAPILPKLEDHIRKRATTDVERILRELSDEPVVTGAFTATVFLWAVVLLLAFPPLFKTLEIDSRDALLMIGAIFAGCLVVAIAGYSLEWIYANIGWSPRVEWGDTPVAIVGWTMYFLVAVYAFWRRFGVRFVHAALFAALWLALVVAGAAALWIFAVPRLAELV